MGPIENWAHARVLKDLYGRLDLCKAAIWKLEGQRADEMVTGGNSVLVDALGHAIRHCRGEFDGIRREIEAAYGVINGLPADRVEWIVCDVQAWLDARAVAA